MPKRDPLLGDFEAPTRHRLEEAVLKVHGGVGGLPSFCGRGGPSDRMAQ